MRLRLLMLFLFGFQLLKAQVDTSIHLKLPATKTKQKITIDGNISDEAWKMAPLATHFVERQPTFGKPERYENRTEIKIIYDDDAIYISGYCHESSRDSVSSELVGRDVIGANDFVGVLFDTYNDKINGFGYYVTPLGEQYDAKYSSNGEDGTWNSVYQTASKIVEDGWTFEMKVPYSAIRFSNGKVQNWGVNLFRRRKKSGQNLTWNPIDQTKYSFFAQFGLWTDIKDIKPPVRLSFSPYLSTDLTNYPYNTPGISNTTSAVNGGMDVKYGINQAFTLDMTLVPDFGQVQSDNHVLNLSPFEVKYNEYRSFFTEGTELFSKGDVFYSRRIGGTPIHFGDVQNDLHPGDSILKNPTSSKIINATKVSGRTAGGLGIGVLNAVTDAQYATILGADNHQYQVQTTPLTNYNILVFDQSMKHNSSVSIINTNVSRNSRDFNSNVTTGLWDLYDKQVKWNFFGKLATSQEYADSAHGGHVGGYTYNVNFAKVSGNFNFTLTQDFADNKYTHQDLGYFTNNNYLDHTLYLGYKWLKPHAFYNNMYFNFNLYYSQHYEPRDYQTVRLNTNINGQFKSLGYYYVTLNVNAAQHDYYEPRADGYYFRRPGSWMLGFYIQSNDAKKFSYNYGLFHRFYHTDGSTSDEIDLTAQYRFNKKLSANINSTLTFQDNNLGHATNINDSVLFALRKVRSVENIYTAKYNFTNKMGISFRLRHYWSELGNQKFFVLSKDGNLTKTAGISTNADDNENYFNIDMVYTWQFRLGSFFTVTWKNAIATQDALINQSYAKNFNSTLGSPEQNIISFKLIYFLDYLDLKKQHR